jgi:hypothetical protein
MAAKGAQADLFAEISGGGDWVMEVNSAERERASAMGECFRFANRKDAPFLDIRAASPNLPFAQRPDATGSGPWFEKLLPEAM